MRNLKSEAIRITYNVSSLSYFTFGFGLVLAIVAILLPYSIEDKVALAASAVLLFLVFNRVAYHRLPYYLLLDNRNITITYGKNFIIRYKRFNLSKVTAFSFKDSYKTSDGLMFIKLFLDHIEVKVPIEKYEHAKTVISYLQENNKSQIIDSNHPLLQNLKK